jgi:hypothetical protein
MRLRVGRRVTSQAHLLDPSLVFRAESAQAIDDQADYKYQSQSAAADGGAAKVKAASAEHQKQNKDEEYWIHGTKITRRRTAAMGSSPHTVKID